MQVWYNICDIIIVCSPLMFSNRSFLSDDFIDSEMQHEIDTYLSKGEAIFSVLLLVGLVYLKNLL